MGDAEAHFTRCLTAPAVDTAYTGDQIFQIQIKWAGIKQMKTPPRQHTLKGSRRFVMTRDGRSPGLCRLLHTLPVRQISAA